eukprot:2787325-Rhodomonas_salina.2
MSGTDLAYGATRLVETDCPAPTPKSYFPGLSAYARATRCLVLSNYILLSAYAARRVLGMSGTEIGFAGFRSNTIPALTQFEGSP